MITIVPATIHDIKSVVNVAYKTWPSAYGQILSQNQMDYMLALFYSEENIKKSIIELGHHFIVAKEEDGVVGFASFELNFNDEKVTKIHKLYLLPETQGKRIGQKLMDYICFLSLEKKMKKMLLNVNRYNKALGFYQKMGFSIICEEDIDIGQDYLMEDFVMEKKL